MRGQAHVPKASIKLSDQWWILCMGHSEYDRVLTVSHNGVLVICMLCCLA